MPVRGIRVNQTLCFSVNQAILGAQAGATVVSPFIGRLDDIGHDGIALIRDIADLYREAAVETQVMAASVRHPLHCLKAAQAGAHIATVPYRNPHPDGAAPPHRRRPGPLHPPTGRKPAKRRGHNNYIVIPAPRRHSREGGNTRGRNRRRRRWIPAFAGMKNGIRTLVRRTRIEVTMTATRKTLDVGELGGKSKEELLSLAPSVGLGDPAALDKMHREDILGRMFQVASANQSLISTGILEIMDEGYGFLRQVSSYRHSGDVYISQSQIRRFGLRTGDTITGQVRPPKEGERYFGLVRVEKVNGFDAADSSGRIHGRNRPTFEHLTPVFPERQVVLETSPNELSTRMVDLFAPIGLGQRGLIVSPPKAGKTTMLKQIAHGVVTNCPEAVLMVALIGERPEEVTDMRRSVDGDVFASTFDENVEEQCRVAELCLDRAKRLVELGKDVLSCSTASPVSPAPTTSPSPPAAAPSPAA